MQIALDPRLVCRILSCAFAAALVLPSPATAETRRALLIGVDTCAVAQPASLRRGLATNVPTSRGRPSTAWSNLEGAVNDVEELKQILIARYGFKAEDVHTLKNADATRNRILAEARKWLIDSASSGDVGFFFYAGHGSQVKNSRSDEADKLDESIVPADANRGALDVRDKELAALFGQALDKNVLLTAMFDSCHSGSIARGLPRAARFRFVQPDDRDVADPTRPPPPETRGALVLSAAQDYQSAAEIEDEQRRPHGLFSWALLKTLRSMPVNQSADRVFLQIRALMQSGQVLQEPVLATTPERRRAPLFGLGIAGPGTVVVAVQKRETDGSVILQGGIAAGIRKDAELRRTGNHSENELHLRVIEEQGLTHSRAVAVNGTTEGLAPGTLFEMVRWTAASGPALRVWIGSTSMTASEVRRRAAALQSVASAAGVTLVDDPTAADRRSNLLQWNGAVWQLVSEDAKLYPVGEQPSAAAMTSLLAADPADARRLTLSLPLPSEAAAALELGAGSENDAIDVLSTPDNADYMLLGRVQHGAIEYAWVRPNVAAEDTKASALPARTEWVALGDDGGDSLARRLRELVLRLGAIRSWAQLEPPADTGRFPYHVALRNTATGELQTTGPTRGGQTFDLVLVLDEAMARSGFDRRFVYVFSMDSDGQSQLLFPAREAGAVENRLPIVAVANVGLPKEIKLQTFTVSEPYGVDTFMMLATATQLADPTVLEGDAVRGRESTRGAADPLTRLLARTGSAKRGRSMTTPTNWSFERLTVQSLPP